MTFSDLPVSRREQGEMLLRAAALECFARELLPQSPSML